MNGHPACDHRLRPYIMRAVAMGLVVTSTSDGAHAATSFHFAKPVPRAVDFGRAGGFRSWFVPRLVAFQRWCHKNHGTELSELFGPSNRANRKWGRVLRLPEGSTLEELHDNHVHVAI